MNKKNEDLNPCCGTCLWYNGEPGDGTQFCDDKEVYVSEYGWCARYREKENENA